MNWRYAKPILVSRNALITFAWSAPMHELAANVGISDVGLKKVLRSHGIITPPQGHWNKVRAGKKVQDPPHATPRGPGESGRVALDERFRGIIEQAEPIPADGPFTSPVVPENLEELRAYELKAIGRAAVPRDLHKPHRGLVKLLKREDVVKKKAEENRWYWDKPAFDTKLGQRKLKLLNALFYTLERRGHIGSAWEQDGTLEAHCMIGNQQLGLTFTVVGKHRTENIAGYQRPARDLPASTPLAISIKRKFRTDIKVLWQDDDAGKLEAKLAEIAADIIVAGEASFRQGLLEAIEREEEQRKWEEKQRQKRIAELNGERLENLKTSGKLLAQAEEIRVLVDRVKVAVVEGWANIAEKELAAWEEWACRYADDLDPVLSGQVLSHMHVPSLD